MCDCQSKYRLVKAYASQEIHENNTFPRNCSQLLSSVIAGRWIVPFSKLFEDYWHKKLQDMAPTTDFATLSTTESSDHEILPGISGHLKRKYFL